MTAEKFLDRVEVAEMIGVKPGTLSRMKLPEPDAFIGSRRGWRRATIEAWNAARPGRGYRSDLRG